MITKPDGASLPFNYIDNQNGDYVVTFEPPEAGEYEIAVTFEGTFNGEPGPLRGSPFLVSFEDHGHKEFNRMDGPLVTKHLRKQIGELDEFASSTLAGISVELKKGDFEGLIHVKEHLRNIKFRNDELQTGQFGAGHT